MTSKEAYDLKLPVITAIPADQILAPHSIPVDAYIQEAENLYNWCLADQSELTARAMSWDMVVDLPVRAGALREAESIWTKQYLNKKEAETQWKERSPLAYDLRNDLLDHFRFAYRRDVELTKKVRAIAEGWSHADMIQDLNDLSVLGKGYPAPLAAINFDMALLDQAAQIAGEMAALLAEVVGDRASADEAKKIRDQAYTHLKSSVDEIYDYGQYVFRDNPERLQNYTSDYLRRLRARRAAKEKEKKEAEKKAAEQNAAQAVESQE
jgi:D-ribose pyranose/furanose isomerase RbsD